MLPHPIFHIRKSSLLKRRESGILRRQCHELLQIERSYPTDGAGVRLQDALCKRSGREVAFAAVKIQTETAQPGHTI